MKKSARDDFNARMWGRIEQDNAIRRGQSEQAAIAGNPQGQYEMAARYRYGWGVNVNSEEAIKLYQAAANQGHAGACYELARLYTEGHVLMNVQQDLNKAMYYADLGQKAPNNPGGNTGSYNQADFIAAASNLYGVIQSLMDMSRLRYS